MTRHRVFVGFVLVAVVWVVAGCNKKSAGGGGGDSPQPGGPPPAGGPAGPQASGPKGTFDTNCAKCHTIGGSDGRKGKGPDLTHVGNEHDAEWIADHIRDPKKHKPYSRMQAYAGILTDEQIKTLAEYLAAMK